MRILRRIAQTAVIAAAMCAMLCQGVQAKGVDTNYTQVNGEVAKGARNKCSGQTWRARAVWRQQT